MEKDEELISIFVAELNRRGLEPLFDQDVPTDLRTEELSDISEMFRWRIKPSVQNPWVSEMEFRLPIKFPDLFRTFIENYRFAEFEVGAILFFANTGNKVYRELSDAI